MAIVAADVAVRMAIVVADVATWMSGHVFDVSANTTTTSRRIASVSSG